MRNRKYLYFCFGILMLCSACGEETIYKVGIKGSLKGIINGYVPYSGTSALADAEVVLEGSEPLITLRTDNQGKFATDGLVTGTYNLVISKEGYGTYKMLGFSFVGGENATAVPIVTLYKMPTIQIKDASVTVTRFQNLANVEFILYSDADDTQSTYGQFRYYLSTDANVSSSQYQDTGILGTYYQAGSHKLYKNFSVETYPAGTNLYVIVYPCTEQYSSYLNMETGKDVFTSVSATGSAVMKITIPN